MKIAKTITRLKRLSQPPNRIGGPALLSARLLGIFAATLAATFATLYFLFNQTSNEAVAIDLLTRPAILWALVGFAVAASLAVQTVIFFLRRLRLSSAAKNESGDKPAGRQEDVHRVNDLTHQVLHLTRSADRLDSVEQDLIRKITEDYQVDLTTRNLLREMRVCTNRLRGQLSYLEQLDRSPIDTRRIDDRDGAKVKAGFDPPDLGMAKYETPRYRRH